MLGIILYICIQNEQNTFFDFFATKFGALLILQEGVVHSLLKLKMSFACFFLQMGLCCFQTLALLTVFVEFAAFADLIFSRSLDVSDTYSQVTTPACFL